MLNPDCLDFFFPQRRKHARWPVLVVALLILLAVAAAFLRGCRHGA